MIELKRPTANMDIIAIKPVVCADIHIKAKAPIAKKDNTRAGLMILCKVRTYKPTNHGTAPVESYKRAQYAVVINS